MSLDFPNNHEMFFTLAKKLKNIGAKPKIFYEAKKYEGPPKNMRYQLCLKDGIFSKKVLILGENKKDLESLLDYINHCPKCRNWKLIVRSEESKIDAGNYMICQKDKFKGAAKENIVKIVKEFGGDENDINFILEGQEKVLGYFPWKDPKIASEYADIIHIGATTPVSIEETISMLEDFKKSAEYRAEMGDKNSRDLVEIWEKLIIMWKNKSKH